MNLKKFYKQLCTLNLPVAYRSFEEGTVPSLPYIIYFVPNTINFAADNFAYAKFMEITIELYTQNKDLDVEENLEKLLNESELYYERIEDYIDSEKLLRQTYTVNISHE